MRVQRGTIRYWLQAIALLTLPHDVRPFSRKWRFKHYQHGRRLRHIVKHLREIADGLEARLDTIEAQVEDCQP